MGVWLARAPRFVSVMKCPNVIQQMHGKKRFSWIRAQDVCCANFLPDRAEFRRKKDFDGCFALAPGGDSGRGFPSTQ